MKKENKQKKTVRYNQYDENKVKQELLKQKEKKRKRTFLILKIVLVIVLIAAFFMSDLSKIQTIAVKGNKKITSTQIINSISVKAHQDIFLFSSEQKIASQVEKLDFVAKATVTKDLFGNINIKIKESSVALYTTIDNVVYIGDGSGKIIKDNNKVYEEYLKNAPIITNVGEQLFNSFLKEYVKLPGAVKNLVSDIVYSPEASDENRFTFYMSDGKVLYLRYDQMVSQLKGDNYQTIISAHPNDKYYDFVGKYVYSHN